MSKDNKINITNKEDDLWNLVTKNDKKYAKTNRVISKKQEDIKIITITKNHTESKLSTNKDLKKNVNNDILDVKNNNINIKELDPNKEPSGISASQADKLKKGKIRPEKIIDLHGYTQFRAHSYINNELLKCYNRNIRSVLIITGKKVGKLGAEGVLKKEVPKWLNVSPLRDIILMTSWAMPKDGGNGALYVLLRRVREFKNKN
jgi:DNA-nicking Smr family endonuclease